MSKFEKLRKLRVAEPCSENWNEMFGNDRVRFCSHCAKSVNDISAMSPKDALRLVRRLRGNICVPYVEEPRHRGPALSDRSACAGTSRGSCRSDSQPFRNELCPGPAKNLADKFSTIDRARDRGQHRQGNALGQRHGGHMGNGHRPERCCHSRSNSDLARRRWE